MVDVADQVGRVDCGWRVLLDRDNDDHWQTQSARIHLELKIYIVDICATSRRENTRKGLAGAFNLPRQWPGTLHEANVDLP